MAFFSNSPGSDFPDTRSSSDSSALCPPGISPSRQILTVPNSVTLVRIACLPVFWWLLFGAGNRAGAAILLGALGATDWVDGWLARTLKQESLLGQIMDPVADRLLFFVGIVAIATDDSAPLWICVVVLAREVAVSIATLWLAALGASRIEVTWLGKTGTFILMFAFPLFLMSHSTVAGVRYWEWAAWVFAIAGIAVSYVAAVSYIPRAKAALKDSPQD